MLREIIDLLFLVFGALAVLAFLLWRISMDVQTLLADVATLSADVDTLIAQATPPDLQPVADAIAAVDAKVKAKIAPPST